jgi:hypothetical protein
MTDEIAQQIVLASRPSVPVGLDRLRSGPGSSFRRPSPFETECVHHAPSAFIGMLEGRNFGKALVQVWPATPRR